MKVIAVLVDELPISTVQCDRFKANINCGSMNNRLSTKNKIIFYLDRKSVV